MPNLSKPIYREKKILLFVVLAGLALVAAGCSSKPNSNNNSPTPTPTLAASVTPTPVITATPSATPTTQATNFSNVPDDTQLLANLKKAGLDALNAEGTAMHIHQHIDIIINNQAITIPAEIGIGSSFISPLHIHDTSGVLHVESPVIKSFTLGQFFTEWGITLNDSCIGSYCSDSNHKLVVAVNGTVIQHPQNLVLEAHQEIEIWYGDKKTSPTLIKNYTFEAGL